jgi:hypothetical protein
LTQQYLGQEKAMPCNSKLFLTQGGEHGSSCGSWR